MAQQSVRASCNKHGMVDIVISVCAGPSASGACCLSSSEADNNWTMIVTWPAQCNERVSFRVRSAATLAKVKGCWKALSNGCNQPDEAQGKANQSSMRGWSAWCMFQCQHCRVQIRSVVYIIIIPSPSSAKSVVHRRHDISTGPCSPVSLSRASVVGKRRTHHTPLVSAPAEASEHPL